MHLTSAQRPPRTKKRCAHFDEPFAFGEGGVDSEEGGGIDEDGTSALELSFRLEGALGDDGATRVPKWPSVE
jgi:hypothetical protein